MSAIEPTGEEVAQALDHVLAWPEMARSNQLAKFLRYIVERTLAGDTPAIKAYSIAVDVLGRPVDFDPQTDPIVRVQARRLRGLLEQYYRGPGALEKVRIELPVGRYVPTFRAYDGHEAVSPPPDILPVMAPDMEPTLAARRRELAVSWFALAVLSVFMALMAYGFSNWSRQADEDLQHPGLLDFPQVRVLEFQSLGDENGAAANASGLAVELVLALQKFENFTVVYGSSGAAEPPAAAAGDYLLSGIVRREGEALQFSTILTEAASRTVVWSMTVESQSAAGDAGGFPQIANTISRSLGNPRGPLHQEARGLLLNQPVLSGGETLYLCQVLFDLYRERSSQTMATHARNCFEALSMRERRVGRVIASLAMLSAETGLEADIGEAGNASILTAADAAMAQAIQAAPVSGFVWEQRARLYEMMGADEAAEAAYVSSLQLNAANADAMAAWAWYLALHGRLVEAEAYSRQAMDSAAEKPAWYLGVPALAALQRGDLAAAIGFAESYSEADHELGPILVVMAGQRSGDRDVVNAYLPRVLEVPEFRSQGVLTRLSERVGDRALLDAVGASLLSAGVPATSLTEPF